MTGLAIHYRREFFGESTSVISAGAARAGAPRGLVGRQVANAEMLAALLRHGSDQIITFLVDSDGDAAELKRTLRQQLPADKKGVIKSIQSLDRWLATADRCVLWEPQPPAATLAWARSRSGAAQIALGGVTHALCSANAVGAIRDLVAAPVRNCDRLVCTSDAVAHTARTLIDHWSGVVGKQQDPNMIQLETIPLGVDCDRHRPTTPQQRREVRARLQIPENADVVLFVGRLSHHAKSNPLPMFAACQRAARQTGRPVVLILAGWYASKAIQDGFENEARRIAPEVRLVSVNAMDEQWRDSIWAAADLFVSLADSVQETFGLTVVEAMSRRIAVIASDWNGYRETIQHGRTGLLVPTTMLRGAGERALLAMHEGRLSYDHFLAAVGQTVHVDTAQASQAMATLLCSPPQRQQLADAGREHVLTQFAWPKIIQRYESLWEDQRVLLKRQQVRLNTTQRATSDLHEPARSRGPAEPRLIPPLGDLFFRYPTVWLDDQQQVLAGQQALGDIASLLRSPLANHAPQWRVDDDAACQLLDRAIGVGNLRQTLAPAESIRDANLDTLAWALKFDLLAVPAVAVPERSPTARSTTVRCSDDGPCDLTFTVTCMGRLEHLQQSLPRLVAQPRCHVVLTDYSCPDHAGQWVRDHYSPDQVTIVDLPGRTHFDRSEAKNAAIRGAATPWICLIDADVLVAEDFSREVHRRLHPHRFLRCVTADKGVGGTIVASRAAVLRVGCHDPMFRDWGEEDDDLIDALVFIGHQLGELPERLIRHVPHDEDSRMRFHDVEDRRISWLINRVYRAAKWDTVKILGELPSLAQRQQLYDQIRAQIQQAIAGNGATEIELDLGGNPWKKLSATVSRSLRYRIDLDPSEAS
jgi:glycosyltransferase involved in cell wall biosynthesis